MNSIKYFDYPSEEKLLGLPPEVGRWLFIPLGLIVLLCLGTVYSWSIFSGPFEAELQTRPGTILLPFMVLGVMFTLVMPISGLYIYRFSPRIMTTVGGIIVGIGYLLASVAPNLPLLVLSYGVIAGIGVGIAYGVPLAVAARWFPDRKGLAVGMTVVGFGLSPLITAPLALNLIKGNSQIGIPTFGVRGTFVILGIAFTVIILAIARVLKMPPPRWQPSNYLSSESLNANDTDKNQSNILPMPQTQTFYGLWICYVVGTFVGLTAIATTAQVGKEIVGLQPEQLVWAVPLFAVFNGAGRPLFGWLNDRLKPKLTVITINILILIASIVMLNTSQGQIPNFIVAFCLFWFCLGAWLAVAPAATLSFFGLDNYPSNYGLIFTSFGIGGLSGIFTAGGIRGVTGSFLPFFWVTATLACIAIITATFLLNPPRKTAIADFLFNNLISPISPGLLSLVEFFLMLGNRK
ncbi:MAG: OFA family MFS transporter [Scytonematopsis contorta HA4267-MV1]|jgi:MFS family permease|nr:OFA family MFS transporter [Scytonematopsis contorta HA4267-MV1]